jgi:outer membrane protein TolC
MKPPDRNLKPGALRLRTLACLFAVVLAAPRPGVAAEAARDASAPLTNLLSLDQVLSEVLSNNPALKAARAQWEAALARVPQARAWEDTRVGVDVERAGTTRLDTFTDNEWMVTQILPLSGRNRQRARMASAEAAAAFTDARRRELDLLARARVAYYRYANALVQLEINRRTEGLLQEFVEITRKKYEVGRGTQAEVLTAETDQVRLLEARADLERQVSDAQSELNVLMNRPAPAELPPPAPSTFRPLAAPRFEPTPSPHATPENRFVFGWAWFQGKMQALTLEQRPELLRAAHQIEAAQASVELARRLKIPDPQLRLEARQFNGSGRVISEYDLGVFFDLPWLNRRKYQAALQEARKNLEAAQHELAARQAEAAGLVRDRVKKVETFQNHYQLVRDRVLPLAEQTLQATRTAYLADRASFLELLTAQRALHENQSLLHQYLTDYLASIAELEAVVGASVELVPATGATP